MIILVIGVQCGPKENKTQIAFEEAMELHDIAMVKSDQLFLLKKSLMQLKDTLLTAETVDSVLVNKLLDQMVDLDDADEAMKAWMSQFNTDYKDEDNQTNTDYYLKQLDMIKDVDIQINNSIEAANISLGR